MQHVTLSIEESRYELLLQFLSTLDYVRVTTTPTVQKNGEVKHGKPVPRHTFLAGMKTSDIPVSRTVINREEIYGERN